MSLELTIRAAEVTIPQAIENFEQLKAELEPRMQKYASLVVSEDGITAAKKDKADLNKLKAAVEDQRKAVKKQCLDLQTTFEAQCKELIAMIDEPICAIDRQIKVFDEQRKQEKYGELEAYFCTINQLPFLKLEDVLDPKWANVTSKLEKLKADMTDRVKRVSEDLLEIKELFKESPMLTAIIEKFSETKDKGTTLAYAAVLEKREQQRLEHEERQTELERIKHEKEEARQADMLVEKTFNPRAEAITKTIDESEPLLGGCFVIRCTKSRLAALRQYMNDNGVELIGTMPMSVYENYKEVKR